MIEIRLAILENIPDLIALRYERALLQRRRLEPNAPELWSSEISGWLNDLDSAVYVAVSDSHVIGYILGQVQPAPPGLMPERTAIIRELVLDLHQYQGGAGRRLVDALLRWFRSCGIEQVFVSVPQYSPVEQAFWRTLGAAKWMEVSWMK